MSMRFVVILFLAALLTASGGTYPFAPAQALAQERSGGGGLLRFLFPRNEPQQQQMQRQAPRPQQQQPRRQRAEPRRQSTPAAQRTTPAAPTVEKADDARTVLVIGDFVAGGLAEGLESAFEADASVLVVNRTNGSSGLVRDDFHDWPGTLPGLIESIEPDAVVVMLGANDRQDLRVDGQSASPRSDPWMREYERRATLIAESVGQNGIPLVWVGMVPFRPSTMSADMLAFNDIYRKATEMVGGEFVDIWDGFTDEAGTFVQDGPDMNGQPTQLRAGDGINLTRAGRRKVAFFVEKPLARALGSVPQPDLVPFGPALPDGFLDQPLATPRIDRTQPIALLPADMSSGNELLGRTRAERTAIRAPRENGPPPAGRVDNFGGPPARDAETTEAQAIE